MIRTKALKGEGELDEENVSTQQSCEKAKTRLPCAHGDQKWSARSEAPTG